MILFQIYYGCYKRLAIQWLYYDINFLNGFILWYIIHIARNLSKTINVNKSQFLFGGGAALRRKILTVYWN